MTIKTIYFLGIPIIKITWVEVKDELLKAGFKQQSEQTDKTKKK
jgi:hypothetical protein